jgi:PAS domain S-box-containing protein
MERLGRAMRFRDKLRDCEEIVSAPGNPDSLERASRDAVRETAEPALICDSSGLVIAANEPAVSLLGNDPVGRAFPEETSIAFVTAGKDDRPAAPDLLAKMASGRLVARAEAVLNLPTGVRKNVIVSGGPFCLGGETTGCAFVTLTDITAQKLAQQSARQTAARLQMAFDTAQMYAWELDVDTGRLVLSEHADRILGKPCQTIEELFALVHPADRESLRNELTRTHVRGETPGRRFRVLRADTGEERWLSGHGRILHDAEHDSHRKFFGVVRDVTEEVRREERQLNLRRLVDSNVIGVMFTNERGDITEANDYVLDMLGYTRAELSAGALHWIEMTPPEFTALDARAIAEAHARGSCTAYEKEYFRKDGARVSILLGYTLLQEASSEYICFVLDLSAQKKAEREQERLLESERAAREEAEAANRSKDEFLAVLSHELRTPMTSILGWASMLQMGLVDGQMMDLALRSLNDSARTQARLIEDLLDISRAATGKLALQYGNADIRETLLAAVENFRLAARSKNISLRMHLLASEPLIILGDTNRIQQVISNLVGNALKFTPVSGCIDIELRREDEEAVIAVRDDGCGIAPDFLPSVFDRFAQQDSTGTRAHGGLGLGLAIVRHIVQMHGGSVEAHSEGRGKGSEFVVRLPLLLSGEANDQRREPAQIPRLDGVRVLVVDDHPENRTFLRAVVASCGAEVDAAESVAEAFRIFDAKMPDVLVSDLAMPVEDGYSLLYRLRMREAERGRRIPALAVSAYGENDRAKVLAAGFDEFIPKPVHPADLARAIASVLGR